MDWVTDESRLVELLRSECKNKTHSETLKYIESLELLGVEFKHKTMSQSQKEVVVVTKGSWIFVPFSRLATDLEELSNANAGEFSRSIQW